ncbi:MAG TPA: ABC transporter ATP-binding protein [Candidatus Paceibacterota bacterium]
MTILYFYLKRYWKVCLGVLGLAVVNQVFSLIDPIIFRHIIDDYANKFSELTHAQFFHGVLLLLLASVGVAFVSRVAKNFQDYYLNTVTQRVGANMYSDGVRHSLALPYSVFEDQRSGETLNILQKARIDGEKFLLSFINIAFISLIGFVFAVVYALTVYWAIALLYVLIVIIVGSLSSILSRKIKIIQQSIIRETSALSGSTTESLRNIELVKSLGLADQEVGRLNNSTDKILALELKKLKYLRSLAFVQGTTINFLRTCILFFMLYLIFNRTITFGEFFALYIYSFVLFGPLQELGTVINNYREAQAALERYQKIMGTALEPTPVSAPQIGDLREIAFENVSFKYPSASHNSLEDINFTAMVGETIAFVGPSGSGKTSLVKLLVSLYEPRNGKILYNNVGSLDIDKRELRKQIGFVTQDTQLFAGSIRENLLFVNPSATDEELLDVLHRSSCDSLLSRSDVSTGHANKGLDTVIGEGGVKVSGGEKQRISIARALLRKPKLLVFDEATSSLDSITEKEITSTMRAVSEAGNLISILIAHRLSTVMHATRIYVLERAKVVETGTHQELILKDGLYKAMWREQIGERT